jgi:DUF305 family protein family protein
MKHAMSRLRCSRCVPKPARFAVALFAIVGPLAACSEAPRSLADYLAAICVTPFQSSTADESLFLAANATAMSKMMIDMGVRPSGNIDADFARMMIAHHQGAIEMALAELRYGHDRRLKRLAQEIVITQQQEIAVMRLALDQPSTSPMAEAVDANSKLLTKD